MHNAFVPCCRRSKKLTEYEKWEYKQLIMSGVLDVREHPLFDEEEGQGVLAGVDQVRAGSAVLLYCCTAVLLYCCTAVAGSVSTEQCREACCLSSTILLLVAQVTQLLHLWQCAVYGCSSTG